MSDPLPVTLYCCVVADGRLRAVFPLSLKKEAEALAQYINDSDDNVKATRVEPAAIQGWLICPGRVPE